MKENTSALFSSYIIDGVKCEASPAELLQECMSVPVQMEYEDCEDIVDESTEPPLNAFFPEESKTQDYLRQCLSAADEDREFRLLYPSSFIRQRIAKALIDRLWNKGHFRLGDLTLWAEWGWNTRPVGSMASFYTSVKSACDYIYDLGVRLSDCIYENTDGASFAGFQAWLPENEDDIEEDLHLKSSPYESTHPWISEERQCDSRLVADEATRLIYIPFDTCTHRLGGSVLAHKNGYNGGAGPNIQDPDYFIDCYEVIRELIEDGIILSGATVCDGGLMTAAGIMSRKTGLDLDISGLLSSYQTDNSVAVLFGEVPGVLVQIHDQDFDYLDSQLLLQDVAYYPIGKIASSRSGVSIVSRNDKSVADILSALLDQATEGED